MHSFDVLCISIVCKVEKLHLTFNSPALCLEFFFEDPLHGSVSRGSMSDTELGLILHQKRSHLKVSPSTVRAGKKNNHNNNLLSYKHVAKNLRVKESLFPAVIACLNFVSCQVISGATLSQDFIIICSHAQQFFKSQTVTPTTKREKKWTKTKYILIRLTLNQP